MASKTGQLPQIESERDEQKPEVKDIQDLRHLVQIVVGSLKFDVAIGAVIIVNAFTQAWEQALTLEDKDTLALKVIESFFLVIYIIELGLRYYASGWSCFYDSWVKLDCLIVLLGMVTSWILEPTMSDWQNGLGLVVVLRLSRLLRIIKTLRVLVQVREFWMLVRGFAASIKLMMYTFALVFVLIYVFGIIGVEVITKHSMNIGDSPDVEFQRHVDEYFSSLPRTMLTLVRYVCMDDLAESYSVLVKKDAALSIYFVAIIICLGIIVMNLVGAVIFNGTLEMNKEEEDAMAEAKKQEMHKLIQDLKALFVRLDEDKSGTITRDEIRRISPEDHEKLSSALGVNTPVEVFQAIDTDGSGRVSIDEFFDSIVDVALKDTGVDMKRLEKQLSSMNWRLMETFSRYEVEKALMDQMAVDIKQIKAKCNQAESRPSITVNTARVEGVADVDLPAWARDVLGKLSAITISAEEQVRAIAAVGSFPLSEKIDDLKSVAVPNGACSNGKVGMAKPKSPPKPPNGVRAVSPEGREARSKSLGHTPSRRMS
eukprot:TRINITY_DN20591_c0_g1_i1.p1 TRINITY_DN20591_c0_g1~~TRINITY_DN20591_c0_g1_i1.p1  ORF type:complete len:541 (-),score=89.47 TRINITY_DN20591_c0_g1_i1:41-1663(-)